MDVLKDARWIIIAVAVAAGLLGTPLLAAGLLIGFEVGRAFAETEHR